MPAYGNIFGNRNPFAGQQPQASVLPKNAFLEAIKRVAPTSRTQPAMTQDPYMAMLERLQSGEANKQYREHVAKLPSQSDYAPSRLRSLGGALTAAAASFKFPGQAQELASQVTEAPYRQALSQWQMKGAGLKEQADIESQATKNMTDRIEAMQKADADWRDYQLKQEANQIAAGNAATTKTWREAQAKHLGIDWKPELDAQGNRSYFNPNTGERRTSGPSIEGTRLGYEGTRLGYEGRRTATGESQAETYKNAVAGFVPPTTQIDAEALAARNVILANPQYKGWVNPDGSIKTANDFTFFAPKADDPGYKDFLAKIEAEKRKILQMQRPELRGLGGIPPPGGPLNFNDLPE